MMGRGEHGEGERLKQHPGLQHQQGSPFVDSVGNDPAVQGQQQNGE